MLDTKESWDGSSAVTRRTRRPGTRSSPTRLPEHHRPLRRGHEYIAAERLFELHDEGGYDLIVVDTPPTRNALDFLDAPERLADFFSSRC